MPTPERLHSFKLDQRGLARVFGELEAEIMDVVWRLGEPTVAEVCEALGPDMNYKTVMTVMNRLVAKRVLVRRRSGRAFVYVAAESREAFLSKVSRLVVEGLLQDFGAVAVAQFVDALDTVDPALVAELAAQVRARSTGGAA
jgi:predicted transcriptional regulator